MKKSIFIILGMMMFSCTKDDIITEFEEQAKPKEEEKIEVKQSTQPRTFTLFKESILNQRSGISFLWNHEPGEHEYVAETQTHGKGWFGNVAYHDVNKDGHQDVLVTYSKTLEDRTLVWYINSGDNKNFWPDLSYFTSNSNGINTFKVLKTDINNDNIVDFISLGVYEKPSENYYSGNLTILIGRPDGKFDIKRIPNPKDYFFHNGAAGDLNGDGFVDFIAAGFIWIGDGKGNFTQVQNFLLDTYTKSPMVYEILDMNGDGWNDLILRGPWENTKIVLNNNGIFNSSNKVVTLPRGSYRNVLDIEIIDIDNDGDLDILELAMVGDNPPDVVDTKYNISNIIAYYNTNLNFSVDETTFSEARDGNYLNGEYDKYGWSNFKIDDIDGDGQDEIFAETYHEGKYNALKKINGQWKRIILNYKK